MKVDVEKVKALAKEINRAITEHLDKAPMQAGEIALALTQVIYHIGVTTAEITMEKALREKTTVAA